MLLPHRAKTWKPALLISTLRERTSVHDFHTPRSEGPPSCSILGEPKKNHRSVCPRSFQRTETKFLVSQTSLNVVKFCAVPNKKKVPEHHGTHFEVVSGSTRFGTHNP